MKYKKIIMYLGFIAFMNVLPCMILAVNSMPSDGTGDTNVNFPSYGTFTMPHVDTAFDDAVNYHHGEDLSVMGLGIGDDLDVSMPYKIENSSDKTHEPKKKSQKKNSKRKIVRKTTYSETSANR